MNQQVIDELKTILGREPTCTQVKGGKFMADYFKVGAKPTQFVADTENEAFEKLLNYLKSLPKNNNV
jgi:hypothetical protein